MGRPTFDARLGLGTRAHDEPVDEQVMLQSQLQHVAGSRVVFLHGDVTEQAIAGVIAQLLSLATISTKPIHLVLSTYGGSIDEMFSLYDTIKFLPAPVYTVALGKVMSAGVLLLASGAKGKRLIGASSRVMIHPVSGGALGNVFEVENQTKEMRALHDRMVAMLAKETKMKRKFLEDAVMKRKVDHFVTPEQAIELGIADKVIGA